MFNLPKHSPFNTSEVTVSPPVDTVEIIRSWVSHFYIKLPEAAFTELASLIAPQLNLEDWMRRHYLTIPPDAYRALVSLLEGRTGTLVGHLESTVGEPAALLPEIPEGSNKIPRIASLEAEVVELNQRLTEARERIVQLETVIEGLTSFVPNVATSSTQVEVTDGATVTFDQPPPVGPLHIVQAQPPKGLIGDMLDSMAPVHPSVIGMSQASSDALVAPVDTERAAEAPKPVPRVIPRATYVPHKGPNKKR